MTRATNVTTLAHTVAAVLLAAAMTPGLALAQVRPAPSVPPVPPAPPAPRIVGGLTAPLLAELDKIKDLQSLGDLQVLSLDEARRALESLQLSGHLLDFDLDLEAIQQAAQQGAQGAAEARALAQREMEVARERMRDQTYTLASVRSGGDYNVGKDLLGQRQYDQAITRFDRVIAQKSANVDGALYWKAYAQYKQSKSDAALATLAQLRKDHPQSRYNADAKALEADIRKLAGQPVNPASLDDDELKVLAISGIQNSDPERAIPLLEGVLNATNSPRVKKQALYVLALSTQPRAHQVLMNYAKGAGNPDLQIEAIRYLAAGSSKQTTAADLIQIYQSTTDTDVKSAIIGTVRGGGAFTFALAGGRPEVVTVGDLTSTVRPSLRGFSGILGPADLWTLFEKESNKDLRVQMAAAFGTLQSADHLTRIIKTEKDADVRQRAVRALGNLKADKSGQMLVDLYGSDQDVATRKAVISALATQNNAEGLVAIARKEANLELKTDIVRRLSSMAPKSKVAADYLMEIIK